MWFTYTHCHYARYLRTPRAKVSSPYFEHYESPRSLRYELILTRRMGNRPRLVVVHATRSLDLAATICAYGSRS